MRLVHPGVSSPQKRPSSPPCSSFAICSVPCARAFASDGCARSERWISLPCLWIAHCQVSLARGFGSTLRVYGEVLVVGSVIARSCHGPRWASSATAIRMAADSQKQAQAERRASQPKPLRTLSRAMRRPLALMPQPSALTPSKPGTSRRQPNTVQTSHGSWISRGTPTPARSLGISAARTPSRITQAPAFHRQ